MWSLASDLQACASVTCPACLVWTHQSLLPWQGWGLTNYTVIGHAQCVMYTEVGDMDQPGIARVWAIRSALCMQRARQYRNAPTSCLRLVQDLLSFAGCFLHGRPAHLSTASSCLSMPICWTATVELQAHQGLTCFCWDHKLHANLKPTMS